jgi:hypothetical protein
MMWDKLFVQLKSAIGITVKDLKKLEGKKLEGKG